MSNVEADGQSVNAAPIATSEVIAWVEKLSGKSDMGENAARLRITAIRQFEELVAEDEPKEVGWILKNIDRLTERWARRNAGAKADTAKTYATRVRTTLQEYLKWSAAPHEYDFKKSPPKKDEPKKAKPSTAKPATPPSIEAKPPAVPEAVKPYVPPAEHMDRIPLGGGRHLNYLPPKDGLFLKDAIRSAYALILACEDYDSSMTPMQVMAQALNGGS